MRRRVPTVKATGRWFHKFHGNYWCVVVLYFESADHAKAALPRLAGFRVADKSPDALVTSASGRMTDKLLRTLKKYRVGDKTHAIDGLPFSIDCGPDFEIAVPVEAVPVATPKTA